MKPKELAFKAKVSVAAVYNCERADRGGRTRTLVKLARTLGLKLRVPDLAALAKERELSVTKLAERAQVAFDTVRGLLARPLAGNVKTLEKLCSALGQPLRLVI
jgi:DNA-binding Xre family transcriptional regulator